ncbi:bifunctional UDP-N-acetylglucosamine diphosphorylase/glucosamine-1-phosphate N-acetyltransferase GlmU [Pseudohongiella sp.]|uniref:MobA-like NTP transferase domain-containing protein n=1 Tax=marine sediment metagenome TaxID=412755 RepID=A0A0F9W9C4_9ZZZZ|nr:bifunctional UDP-N-acetylglucosamine diphosphorylase/glucosamine-1-phosphate N-acetyltransferase GlmU [Pseudohongiella sp.]HDZ08641.1 UDP-N-acetylglucosamine diphosphorylase/glucosamine-1-phosphate N-acetyltransferase [Pseudohongiella sp.]HEA62257.1 UDP-N-acetylglucosamine diphosphorylase/glucosamine-1-phosphate N-acetyltransferase [Pseudohongiella sp.]
MSIDVIVLAAGKGTRMYSDQPKVLHTLAGKPMLSHVLDAATAITADTIHVVTGYQSSQVRAYFAEHPVATPLKWVEQTEQLGTGHAVLQAIPAVDDDKTVLVLYGDVPLITPATLQQLRQKAEETGIAVLTLITDNPTGLGRIIRDEVGQISAIVEEKDASDEQKKITEINTGIMAFSASRLKQWLQSLTTANAQGEYYLTDTVAIACGDGCKVSSLLTHDENEVQGVNNRLQLADLERSYQIRRARELALQGVTVHDPARLDIRGPLQIGRDVCLDVNIILAGSNRIGDRVSIGPNVTLINSDIGNDCVILANSHIEGAKLSPGCTIGPFARLRPGTELGDNAKIGNFVETKKSTIGAGSKVNHLSYIGDASVAENVNIGAGTITCNYDGVNKHKTTIRAGVFVGSNTALVAPVTVGREATIAAGSVVTADVPDNTLAVARGRQKNISGWKRPVKK